VKQHHKRRLSSFRKAQLVQARTKNRGAKVLRTRRHARQERHHNQPMAGLNLQKLKHRRNLKRLRVSRAVVSTTYKPLFEIMFVRFDNAKRFGEKEWLRENRPNHSAGVRPGLARLTIGRRANSSYELRPIALEANERVSHSRIWRRRSFWGRTSSRFIRSRNGSDR
jgi:hypothetical protein